MRPPWKPLALLAASILLASLGLAALTLQTEALVGERSAVSASDIERAMALARRHDPRRQAFGRERDVVLTQRDLELLLNHGARRWLSTPAVRVLLTPFRGRVQASAPLAIGPIRLWLNLDLQVRDGLSLPEIERLRLGRLPVPGAAAMWLLRRAGDRLGLDLDPQIAQEVVQRVSLSQGTVTVTYTWQADTQGRLVKALVSPAEQVRLKAYADLLAELASAQVTSQGGTPLSDLLPAMFELARQRTAADGGDAAAENRAALVVLAFHASGRELSAIVPAAQGWARPHGLRLTLHGREDFPQHYLISAVLAAEGSSPLADAVGVYKEVADARGGSGFSFNDIAADRAGTRFGEISVQQPARLQAALTGALQEIDLMPDVSDLPEFLPEPEFRRRFGGVGAPAYLQMLAEIDARIVATPLLR